MFGARRPFAGKVTEAPKTHWLSRSGKLANMAAKLTGQEIRQKVRGRFQRSMERLEESELATRVQQAAAVVETLGQLKGAVMKAGQLLSIDASDILPPEALDVLAQLQSAAEPVDFARLEPVVAADLGDDWAARFEHFDREPAAAASIGQVHRGRVNGTDVAVKIQYPGIRESIDSDLVALKRLASSWLKLSRRPIDLEATFAELSEVLHREADYTQEKENLLRYGAHLASDSRFIVPRPFENACGSRVLTMSWEEGIPLHDWLRTEPEMKARLEVAHAMLDLYCAEFFEWGFVQTDPNLGNFTRRPDGRLVLLDLGAALDYDADFRERYVALLQVIGSGDESDIVRAGVDMQLLDSRESDDTQRAFVELLRTATKPFFPDLQPFRFGGSEYTEQARKVSGRFIQSLRYSPPPRRLLFLHRKLGGIFNLLRRMDVVLDLTPYWSRMVGSEIGGARA